MALVYGLQLGLSIRGGEAFIITIMLDIYVVLPVGRGGASVSDPVSKEDLQMREPRLERGQVTGPRPHYQ